MPRGNFHARPPGLIRLPGGHRRLWLLQVIVLGLFVLLVARLWGLQVLASEHYQTPARNDFVRDVVLPAPRGQILDRTGKVVVGNQTSWSVLVDPSQSGATQGAALDRLAALLGVPRSRIDQRLRTFTSSPFAIPMAENVRPKVLFELAEHADRYPGVSTEPVAVRSYRYGTAAAQVLGYLGPVTADKLKAPAYRGALPGDDVGQAGVEQADDQVLRGHDGLERLEVDAQGRVVRVLSVTQPVPGENLRLSIDIGLQRQLDADLAGQITRLHHAVDPRTRRPFPAPSGAAVVLDPRDGSVLAMSSYPSYDPSVWVGGVSDANYRRLTDPSAHQPLLNRAISGLYAPGSTFKLVTATAALDDGLIDQHTIIDDPGSFTIPGCVGRCSFHNDSNEALGPLDVSRALSASDDVFFYNLGYDFWAQQGRYGGQPIQGMAQRYGLGQATGIALPGESAGRVDQPDRPPGPPPPGPGRLPQHRLVPGPQPGAGLRPGRHHRHPAAARAGLRDLRQRRHPLPAPPGARRGRPGRRVGHPLRADRGRARAAAGKRPRPDPAGPGRRGAAAGRHRHRDLPGLPLRRAVGGGQDRHRQRCRPRTGRLVRLLRTHQGRPLRHGRVDRPGRLRCLGGRPGRQAGATVPGHPPRQRRTVAWLGRGGTGDEDERAREAG